MSATAGSSQSIWVGVILVVLAGCGAIPHPPQEGSLSDRSKEVLSSTPFPRSVRTIDGEIVVPKKPGRIVSQTLFTDEVLLEICPLDRLAGIHSISLDPAFSNCVDLAEPVKERAVNGTEAVLSLEPDLVFVASFSRAEVVDQLQSGCLAPIVRFSHFDSLEDIRANIRTTGYLIGEETAAEELVENMDRRIEAAIAGIPSRAKPPCVVSFGPNAYTAGGDTLFDDLLRTVGAVNLSAENGVRQFGQIGIEQVSFWDPDWVICGADPEAEDATRRWFFDNPVLQSTKAGKEEHLLLIPNRLYTATSHHIATLVELLARELYRD